MKKTLPLFLFLFAAMSLTFAQTVVFSDNFDSYTAGSYLAQSNSAWTTWSDTPGSSQDGIISNTQSASAPNSLFITGDNDQLYRFDDLTEGHYNISFNMFIPSSGNGAYFNVLHIFTDGTTQWAFACYFDNSGMGYLHLTASSYTFSPDDSHPFNYPSNTWFPVEIDVNLNNDWATLIVNHKPILSWPFHYIETGISGNNQLAGIDFFSSSATIDPTTGNTLPGEYYVDDFVVLSDVVSQFNANTNTLTASLAPNSTATLDVSLANSGSAPTDYKIVTTYDITDIDTTSTGPLYGSYYSQELIDSGFDSLIYTTTILSSHYEIAIGFPSTSLHDQIGKTLREISFPMPFTYESVNLILNAKIRVYDMNNPMLLNAGPGEVIYEQSFDPTITNLGDPFGNWKTVILDTPIVIDGRDLWFGIAIDNPYALQLPVISSALSSNYQNSWIKLSQGWIRGPRVLPFSCMVDGTPITPWLSVEPVSGIITTDDNAILHANFYSAGMEVGESHTAKLHCFSTSPNTPEIVIPVSMNVAGVSVNEHNQIEVKLYPNPASDFVQVSSDMIERVEIHNMLGQKVYDKFYGDSHVVIPTNGMAPGTYAVTVYTSGEKVTKQVIIK